MNILNDTEHRLFLSAMQREKKICEQFDNSDDSGIKLLPICRSIERKVGKAIEPRKGHWIGDGHGHIVCTACNSANVTIWKSNFCPSCGADMREGEE